MLNYTVPIMLPLYNTITLPLYSHTHCPSPFLTPGVHNFAHLCNYTISLMLHKQNLIICILLRFFFPNFFYSTVTSLKFIQLAACINSLYLSWWYTYTNLFTHSVNEGCLVNFQLSITMNKGAVIMYVQSSS